MIDAERSIFADQTLLRSLSCLADVDRIVDLEQVVERDRVVVPSRTHPADRDFTLPWWKAMPPSAKNTANGIGLPPNSALRWSTFFHSTLKSPRGVSLPGPPELMTTGPRTTAPSSSSHARLPARSTQARASSVHGVPSTRDGPSAYASQQGRPQPTQRR